MDLPTFKWVDTFLASVVKDRRNIVNKSLEAIKTYVKGKTTEKGLQFFKFLMSEQVELIGVCPFIVYLMHDDDDKEKLEVCWKHDFSIPTLLYHIKGTPFLLLANANVDYNKSKLLEIKENSQVFELKNLRGING